MKTPKSLVKVVRAHTRELKRQRKGETEKAAIQALGDVAKTALSSIGNIGQGIARAHGTAIGAWLANPNPITWVGGAVATAAYITWLSMILKNVAEKLGLKDLADMIPLGLESPVEAFKDISQKVAGRDDENGTFGVGVWDEAKREWESLRWFTNTSSQDVGYVLLVAVYPEAVVIVTRRRVWKITRRRVGGGWVIEGGPPPLVVEIPGEWMITGEYGGVRIRISAGYATQAEAEAAMRRFIDEKLTGATGLRVDPVVNI